MLRVENLVKSFTGTTRKARRQTAKETGAGARERAVDDVSFEVSDGQLFTLLGPSGCGKTTTLRSIAGLEEPDTGSIRIDDRVLFSATGKQKRVNVSANDRALGMVFQSYAIWPHMSVFKNAAFPLQVKQSGPRLGKREVSERVMRVLDVMQLGDYAGRPATKLSGGQQQRLALARAIITEPPLLLLDEPLSNLDSKLRESLRLELKRLQRERGITSVYVTHDQAEALALSSQIAVMNEGRILQVGRPRDIYENPNCLFVAEFIGTAAFIRGTVAMCRSGQVVVESSEGRLRVETSADVAVGSAVIVSIRPEALSLDADGDRQADVNRWPVKVRDRDYQGEHVDHVVISGPHQFHVRSEASISIAPGNEVILRIDSSKITIVPSE